MEVVGLMDPYLLSGKRVLVTGHNGFKGSWLSTWLLELGATVGGYSLPVDPGSNLYTKLNLHRSIESVEGDVRDNVKLTRFVNEFKPDLIIHMAAQPLVRRSYEAPRYTFDVNVMGTINILEAARACGTVAGLVNVTTDKCYENKEWLWGYRETEELGGFDPYSSSKACSEIVTQAYRRSFFSENAPLVASARAGNVIGGGDYAVDRLIPDLIRSFAKGEICNIRRPESIRPWQHVLEPLSGYLSLAVHLSRGESFAADSWNFGPRDIDARPVREVANLMVSLWPCTARWREEREDHIHEASNLRLDTSKAEALLQWRPVWSLEEAVEKTVEWAVADLESDDLYSVTKTQIAQYVKQP